MKKFFVFLCFLISIGMLTTTTAQATNYAVLFSGGIDKSQNSEMYYDETLRMYNILTTSSYYNALDVYVLFADGTDSGKDLLDYSGPGPTPITNYVDSDWSAVTNIEAATPTNLQARLGSIGSVIGSDDLFFFWSLDHGFNTGAEGSGGLSAWGPGLPAAQRRINDDAFASWLAPIYGKNPLEAYFFGECHSYDMANDLMSLTGHENRFAAWSANWDESSYGDYAWGTHETLGWIDSLADGFNSGLTSTGDLGQYAMNNDPFAPPGDGFGHVEHPGYWGLNFDIMTGDIINGGGEAPVPEPATMLLLGSGLVGLFGIGRKKFKRG